MCHFLPTCIYRMSYLCVQIALLGMFVCDIFGFVDLFDMTFNVINNKINKLPVQGHMVMKF